MGVDDGPGADGDADRDIEVRRGRRYNPFLSFKFYTFSSAFFGLTGTVLTLLAANPIGVFVAAVVIGLTAGVGITYLLHMADQSQGGRVVTGRDFAGRSATVTIPIRSGRTGKVKFRLKGQLVEMMAKNVDDGEDTVLDFGEECFVLGIDDGVVQVVHPSQLKKRSGA